LYTCLSLVRLDGSAANAHVDSKRNERQFDALKTMRLGLAYSLMVAEVVSTENEIFSINHHDWGEKSQETNLNHQYRWRYVVHRLGVGLWLKRVPSSLSSDAFF
jgi:5-deoxy-D-glucuronate isomerase